MTLDTKIPTDVLEELQVIVATATRDGGTYEPAMVCAWDVTDEARVRRTKERLSEFEPAAMTWLVIEANPGDPAAAQAWFRKFMRTLRRA